MLEVAYVERRRRGDGERVLDTEQLDVIRRVIGRGRVAVEKVAHRLVKVSAVRLGRSE
jgi:hypothetical protein